MSSIVVSGDTSGAITLAATAVAGTNTLTLPALTGTVLTTATAGTVLQVVNTIKTDTFSSSTTGTWTDITGLSVSITPKSSTNKIMIVGQVFGASNYNGYIRILRDSTPILIGDTSSSRTRVTSGSFYFFADNNIATTLPFSGLDSPATTSSTTYKIQFFQANSSFYVNRSIGDGDVSDQGRGISSITLMEVAA